MAQVLLLTTKDLKTLTPLGGNVDVDKIKNLIKVVQDTTIQQMIGTRLLTKVIDLVVAGTISGTDYETLLDDYLKPCLAWHSAAEYTILGSYQITNAGVYRHQPDTGDSLERSELFRVSESIKDKAEAYGEIMLNYLYANPNLFPEFNQYEQGDVQRSGTSYTVGWVL